MGSFRNFTAHPSRAPIMGSFRNFTAHPSLAPIMGSFRHRAPNPVAKGGEGPEGLRARRLEIHRGSG